MDSVDGYLVTSTGAAHGAGRRPAGLAVDDVREVGVRELRDHLSRYLRYVDEGGEVVVTIRGRRVARLSMADDVDPLADLRARGLVRGPLRSRRRPSGKELLAAGAPVSDLVGEQRR